MTKRSWLVLMLLTVVLVLGSSTLALAYPNHTSLAWVNPNYDSSTLSGTAQYHIEITSANAGFVGVDKVYLGFDTAVFASWSVVSSLPAGWSWSYDPGTSVMTFAVGSNTTPMVVGNYLDVWVDYTLLGQPEDLPWYEGHPWHQNVTTVEVNNQFGFPMGAHGTSTEPVPEPATALLFGSGMVLIGYLRKR